MKTNDLAAVVMLGLLCRYATGCSKSQRCCSPYSSGPKLLRRLRPRLITAKQHPLDGRKITVTLTPQRLDIVRQVRARNREILASSLSIGPEERRRLDELVTLIINIPHAQALNHLGGKARAKCLSEAEIAEIASEGGATKLSAAERSRIAKLAVAAREGQRKGKSETQKAPRNSYQRDSRILKWHGWHAARRGLGINLYRLDVSDI